MSAETQELPAAVAVGPVSLGRLLGTLGQPLDGRPPVAGTEISGLLGRMPSSVGYQPTLVTALDNCERFLDGAYDQLSAEARYMKGAMPS